MESRLKQTFIPITADHLVNRHEDCSSEIKQKFLFEVRNFYANSLVYLNEWTKSISDFDTEQEIIKFVVERCNCIVHDNNFQEMK